MTERIYSGFWDGDINIGESAGANGKRLNVQLDESLFNHFLSYVEENFGPVRINAVHLKEYADFAPRMTYGQFNVDNHEIDVFTGPSQKLSDYLLKAPKERATVFASKLFANAVERELNNTLTHEVNHGYQFTSDKLLWFKVVGSRVGFGVGMGTLYAVAVLSGSNPTWVEVPIATSVGVVSAIINTVCFTMMGVEHYFMKNIDRKLLHNPKYRKILKLELRNVADA